MTPVDPSGYPSHRHRSSTRAALLAAETSESSSHPGVIQRRSHKRRHPPGHVKPPVWHFGLRSVSPPMEVILELYKSLERLGIEWREKRGEWAVQPTLALRPTSMDEVDRDDLDIFTVDIRCRKRNSVVLMTLKLYQTEPQAYMVDFKCRGHYRASTSPSATSPFERDESLPSPYMDLNTDPFTRPWVIQNNWMNPFLFFECACELIVELTGIGGE